MNYITFTLRHFYMDITTTRLRYFYTVSIIFKWEASIWTVKLSDFRRLYEGVSKRFRTGRQERELQKVQHSATGCSCIVIL
jgi:hypothetical protein